MFFDIGANIGKWSLDNCDKIIAVEAAPNTFNKLIITSTKKKNETKCSYDLYIL